MFIDFINQTIYGDKCVYLSHFNIDKEVAHNSKYVAFKMYIDINEYHNKKELGRALEEVDKGLIKYN